MIPENCPYLRAADASGRLAALSQLIGQSAAVNFYASIAVSRYYEYLDRTGVPVGTHYWFGGSANINEVRVATYVGVRRSFGVNTYLSVRAEVDVEKDYGNPLYALFEDQSYRVIRGHGADGDYSYGMGPWAARPVWIMPGHRIKVMYKPGSGGGDFEVRIEGWKIATPYLVDQDNLQWVLPEIRDVVGGLLE